MQSLKTILEIIMTDLSIAVPPLLAAAGLIDFAAYVQGPPRDNKITTCAIMYVPEIIFDTQERRLPVMIYLQLCSIDYDTALQYIDILKTFIENFDIKKIGTSLRNEITVDIIPIDRERNTDVYITTTFVEPLDSCDD